MNNVQGAITAIREAIQKRITSLNLFKVGHYLSRVDELELLLTHLPEEKE